MVGFVAATTRVRWLSKFRVRCPPSQGTIYRTVIFFFLGPKTRTGLPGSKISSKTRPETRTGSHSVCLARGAFLEGAWSNRGHISGWWSPFSAILASFGSSHSQLSNDAKSAPNGHDHAEIWTILEVVEDGLSTKHFVWRNMQKVAKN